MKNQDRPKQILHLDMDAFYPAVEVLDNPALKGKPVIVGGSKQRGVVSSASYEARRFGVHSALPMATAGRLCPQGIILPVRMSRYKEVSTQVFDIFYRFTPLVEPLSIDEAFLDVTGSARLLGKAEDVAKKIKQTVLEETGLIVSAGVAPSKFVAKIASDIDKPDGLTVVLSDGVREFLDPLPIQKMWGVGKATQKAMARLGIHTFRDLSRMSAEVLEEKLGKHGVKMHTLSLGVDERDVITEHAIKSIGHEQTFHHNIIDLNPAKKELLSLANRIGHRMRQKEVTGRTVTLKVKYHDFVQITRAETLPKTTDDGLEIYTIACKLIEKTEVAKRPVRLLGISMSQLSYPDGDSQLKLFDQDNESQKRKKLNRALDSVSDKFGSGSIRPGTLINK